MTKSTPKTTSNLDLQATLARFYPGDPEGPYFTAQDIKERRPRISTFSLADNPELRVQVIDKTAGATGSIETLNEFQRLFQLRPQDPPAPDPDDPSFVPAYHIKDPVLRKLERARNYRIARDQHRKRLAENQALKSKIATVRNNHTKPSNEEYCAFAEASIAGAKGLFTRFSPVAFDDEASLRHTFISGGTGSGKSETLKHLIRRHAVGNPKSAVIVFDPHGKLATEIAAMDEVQRSGRLLFIDPGNSAGYRVTFNPFQSKDTSESAIQFLAIQLSDAIQAILGDLSPQMANLVFHVVNALLVKDKPELGDLIEFMNDAPLAKGMPRPNEPMRLQAIANLRNRRHWQYFEGSFRSANLTPSKEGVLARIQRLLSYPVIDRFLSGQSTFDLHRALDEKKIIVFNLTTTKLGNDGCKLIGQLMTAYILAYAKQRRDDDNIDQLPQHPIHLFADEAHYFFNSGEDTKELFKEARKFGLHVTLATQNTNDIPREISEAILNNFGVFLAGRSAGATADTIGRRIGISPERLGALPTGRFYLFEVPDAGDTQRPTRCIANPDIGNHYAIRPSEYSEMMAQQYARYYKPIETYQPEKERQPDDVATLKDHQKPLALPDINIMRALVTAHAPDGVDK